MEILDLAKIELERWHSCSTLDRHKNIPQLRLAATALRASILLWEGVKGSPHERFAVDSLTANLALFQKLLAESAKGVTLLKVKK